MKDLNNLFRLDDKNIIITGASSGIGRECAIMASKLGANVVLIGRNKERLIATQKLLNSEGKHLIIEQDINSYDSLGGVIKSITAELGAINGFIHSAGIEISLPLNYTKPKDYEQLFTTNVIAGYELAKHISKKKNYHADGTSFVFISSVMGLLGTPGKIGYCSSKGALLAGSKAMAIELASKNIRVNSVSPGLVETEMTKKMLDSMSEEAINQINNMHPLGLGKPEDVSSTCLFLLSDASRWITGSNIIIDGGYSAQ